MLNIFTNTTSGGQILNHEVGKRQGAVRSRNKLSGQSFLGFWILSFFSPLFLNFAFLYFLTLVQFSGKGRFPMIEITGFGGKSSNITILIFLSNNFKRRHNFCVELHHIIKCEHNTQPCHLLNLFHS